MDELLRCDGEICFSEANADEFNWDINVTPKDIRVSEEITQEMLNTYLCKTTDNLLVSILYMHKGLMAEAEDTFVNFYTMRKLSVIPWYKKITKKQKANLFNALDAEARILYREEMKPRANELDEIIKKLKNKNHTEEGGI